MYILGSNIFTFEQFIRNFSLMPTHRDCSQSVHVFVCHLFYFSLLMCFSWNTLVVWKPLYLACAEVKGWNCYQDPKLFGLSNLPWDINGTNSLSWQSCQATTIIRSWSCKNMYVFIQRQQMMFKELLGWYIYIEIAMLLIVCWSNFYLLACLNWQHMCTLITAKQVWRW